MGRSKKSKDELLNDIREEGYRKAKSKRLDKIATDMLKADDESKQWQKYKMKGKFLDLF